MGGLMEIGKPKAGETIVISSAAGQMGHLVGQIAKILGLRVLGYTGDGDKASWLKTELGFDWVFNYKTQDIGQTLNIAAFNVYRYHHLWESARERLSQWVKEDKLQACEHPVEGFDQIPKAFVDMMDGVSQGKVIVRM